jgi:hypothetical protein
MIYNPPHPSPLIEHAPSYTSDRSCGKPRNIWQIVFNNCLPKTARHAS